MQDKKYLMIPGPTPIPPAVMSALAKQMIGHRSDDFAELHKVLQEKLKKVFQTKNDIFILTNSGTGGMEAAIANTVSPGDKVLALITGNFGERFANIAKEYGGAVEEVNFGWGNSVSLNIVEEKMKADQEIKIVLATQNETSTGVLNDIEGISKIVARYKALLLVDAVSGLGAIELKTDEWGVDIVVTASQKAFMLPPGLAMVSVNQKAWDVIEKNKNPRFYLSLMAARESLEKLNTAYTPAVGLFLGLDSAVDMMLAEGMNNVYARHNILAAATRAAIRSLGLQLLAADDCASSTVTAIHSPTTIPADDIRKVLRKKYGVTFAGGQGILKGKIFRIAHMGFVDKMDILMAISVLEMALAQLGYKLELGSGVRAAQEVFLKGA